MSASILLLMAMFICCAFLFYYNCKVRFKNSPHVKIHGQHYLSPKERLMIINWNQKEYLCFASPAGLTVIDKKNKVHHEAFEDVLAQVPTN